MKVVILCGGRGTRLVEETEYRPKPMVHVGDRPILTHIMDIYSGYGFKDFILTLGYKGAMIKDYFLNFDYYTNDFTIDLGEGKVITPHTRRHPDWRITLANTGEETLTGGRIKRIEQYIEGDTFMLTYGDGVSDIEIDQLLNYHRKMGKIATVTGVHPMTRFGELDIEDGLVKEFREKPQVKTGLINGGFFVFQREVFDYLSEDGSLEREPLENLARDGELAIFPHDGFWHCMDTYRDMEHLNEIWASGDAPWKQ
ncbi:MAG TPA: glucose-1-phosphate cytidylyltransferase [Proteobacteria bacterium]|nr:glucose-1-phosphate cytidylyltransferase [Pseudomonadota bacterium]